MFTARTTTGWSTPCTSEQIHQHQRWAQATTVLRVAIALAAIALLTDRCWLAWGTVGLGAVGVVLGGLAFWHV